MAGRCPRLASPGTLVVRGPGPPPGRPGFSAGSHAFQPLWPLPCLSRTGATLLCEEKRLDRDLLGWAFLATSVLASGKV